MRATRLMPISAKHFICHLNHCSQAVQATHDALDATAKLNAMAWRGMGADGSDASGPAEQADFHAHLDQALLGGLCNPCCGLAGGF